MEAEDGPVDDIENLLSMKVSKDYINCVWTHEPSGKVRRMESSPEKLVIADVSEPSDLETEKVPETKKDLKASSSNGETKPQPRGRKRKKISKPKITPEGSKKVSEAPANEEIKGNSTGKISASPSSLNTEETNSLSKSSRKNDKGHGRKVKKNLLVVSSLQKVDPLNKLVKTQDQSVPVSEDLYAAYKNLVVHRSLPPYSPKHVDERFFNGKYFCCKACGDKFIMETSLLTHMSRKTAVFSYQCKDCKASLSFDNRCCFILHITSHGINAEAILKEDLLVLPFSNEDNECGKLFKHVSSHYIRCPECSRLVTSLQSHLQEVSGLDPSLCESKASIDSSLSCKECFFLLPSRCAYFAHLRFHKGLAPHMCPDCGEQFLKSSTLLRHMKEECYHDEKRTIFKCAYCKIVVMSIELFTEHLISKHLRSVYVCHICGMSVGAFEEFNSHRVIKHGLPDVNPVSGTAALCARVECDKCPGVNISLDSLKHHAVSHTSDPNLRGTIYQCRACKIMLSNRELMASHKSACKGNVEESCNSDAERGFYELSDDIISLFQPPASSQVSDSSQAGLSPSDSTSVLESLRTDCEVQARLSECENKNPRPNQACGVEVKPENSDFVKTKSVPETSSLKSGHPSKKKVVCRLCKEVVSVGIDRAALKKHFTSQHYDIFMKAVHDKRSRTDGNVMHKEDVAEFLKALSIDSSRLNGSSKIKPKIESKKKHKASNIKVKSPGKIINLNLQQVKSGFHCYKCSFTREDEEEFKAHIVSHKSNPTDLQCPMCGLCFIVRPPLEKHLIVQHGVRDAENYLASHGFEDHVSEEEDQIVDVEHVETEELQENQCKVCRKIFESAILLEKHFRVHGGAFLLASMKAKRLNK